MWTRRDREDRFRRASLSLGRKSVAGPAHLPVLSPQRGHRLRQPAGLSDRQPKPGMAGWQREKWQGENWTQRDSAGLHGT